MRVLVEPKWLQIVTTDGHSHAATSSCRLASRACTRTMRHLDEGCMRTTEVQTAMALNELTTTHTHGQHNTFCMQERIAWSTDARKTTDVKHYTHTVTHTHAVRSLQT